MDQVPTPGFHDFRATTADGAVLEMSTFRGRPVLVVNTATECGFTPQLRGLQELQERFGDRGLTVLGFPSDQFRQNPEGDLETAERCAAQFGVTFPLMAKVDVNGALAHPLWAWLRQQRGGVLGGRIAWNFTKFLIGGDGTVVRRFAPPVPPARIARAIEAELAG